MSRRSLLALVLTATALSGGCGTINNINKPTVAPADNPNASVRRIYGGVREDWDGFWSYPWGETTPTVDYVSIPILAALGLALDGIGDTFTLPVTVVSTVRRALEGPSASSGYVTVPMPPSVSIPVSSAAPAPAVQPAPLPIPKPVPVTATGRPAVKAAGHFTTPNW